MCLDCFSKPLWALALCLCLMGCSYASNEFNAYNISPPITNGVALVQPTVTYVALKETVQTTIQKDLCSHTQNTVHAYNQDLRAVPSNEAIFSGFDLDKEVNCSPNISAVISDASLNSTLALFFDFDADNKAKPKPGRSTPQHENKDPWSEVSNFFKQYKRS